MAKNYSSSKQYLFFAKSFIGIDDINNNNGIFTSRKAGQGMGIIQLIQFQLVTFNSPTTTYYQNHPRGGALFTLSKGKLYS